MYDQPAHHRLDVVIVTGLSGSGKSTAIHVLEDLGYYCIDNLPVVLLPRFLDLCESSLETLSRVALGVDIREREFLAAFPSVLADLQRGGYRVQLVFLDAADDVLVRRFSETRRPHPLGGDGGPLAGIQRERQELQELRDRADRIVDTTALTVHELRDELRGIFEAGDASGLSLLLLSFGFKFGVPSNVDIVLDARFLANPFFVDELRDMTGLDEAVATYVLDRDETRGFLERIEGLLQFTLPLHRKEGRSYLTVAIGCTGGHHRSVAIVERLAGSLRNDGHRVQVRHRDIQR
jgi:RNase adapter protein RapZ